MAITSAAGSPNSANPIPSGRNCTGTGAGAVVVVVSGIVVVTVVMGDTVTTVVSATTVVFVASTGEWTRRRVRDARAAHDLANRLGVPSYDAAVVGYPQRMREWNASRSSRPSDGGSSTS